MKRGIPSRRSVTTRSIRSERETDVADSRSCYAFGQNMDPAVTPIGDNQIDIFAQGLG
jgi:hypothetical protein